MGRLHSEQDVKKTDSREESRPFMTEHSQRKVAFITGASRGIGRACAIALAEKGFDIAVTARTVKEGETADGRPLPGSIESTALEVRRRGREALPLRLDLLDLGSIEQALATVRSEWGEIDLLLNNGIYTGEGNMLRVLELPDGEMETMFRANVFAPTFLVQKVLSQMVERASGCIINMVSAAGQNDPPAPAREGGWGYAYGASKGAIERMAGVLAVEHPDPGLCFYNVEPGFVMTEAMHLNDPDGELQKRLQGAPPSVPASVVAWLATEPAAREWNGQTVSAQPFCLERDLHPDWRA